MPANPTLFLVGSAEREVTPDEVHVALSVQTRVHATSQPALADAAEKRSRVKRAMEERFPAATVSDARITVRDETKALKTRTGRDTTEYRHELLGYTGHCTLIVRAGADQAGALVAHGGMHPDITSVHPRFNVSRALAREVERELECEAIRDALSRAEELAAAAGHAVDGLISIGEHPPTAPRGYGDGPEMFSAELRAYAGPPGDVEDDLSELTPEPELRTEHVPVRVALTSPTA
jgi:uncharacterized protein YggE